MKKNRALTRLLLPSALGVGGLYLLPFFLTLCQSLTGPGGGLSLVRYGEALMNPMFRLGAGNFFRFALIAIPAAMVLSLGLALLLRETGRGFLLLLFSLLLPFVAPSGSTAFFWNSIFGLNGLINRLLFQQGLEIVLWDSSRWSILIPVVLYLWRFCGFFALLFLVGLYNIPEEYYEIARLEGAGRLTLFWRVTLVYLAPALVIVLLLSFICTFRISRELFMLFGRYPDQNLYFLQHFLQNQLGSMNLPILCAATVVVTLITALAVLPLWRAGKRASDSFGMRGEGTRPFLSRRQRRGRTLLVLALAALFLLPVLLTVSNSFMSPAEAAGRYSPAVLPQNAGGLARGGLHFVEPALFPSRGTVSQYAAFLLKPAYLRMFWNSVGMSLPVVLFHVIVSVTAAYAFFRSGSRGMRGLFAVYMLLMVLPVQVMLTPQYLFFRMLGLAGSWLPVLLPAIFHPIGVYIIRLQLQGFPQECVEAAQLDGAGEGQIFTQVVLPNLKSSVLLLAVYTFGEAWNLVDQAVVFIQDGYRLPLSVFLSSMLQKDLGLLSAGSVLYLLPPCLFFLTCLLWLREHREES